MFWEINNFEIKPNIFFMISYAFKRTKYLSTIIVTYLIKTKMHRIINKLPIRIENLEPWGKINAVNNYLFLIKIVNKKVKLTLIAWSQSNFTTKHTHSILCFNLWHKIEQCDHGKIYAQKIGLNIGCVGDLHLILFCIKHICNCMLTTLLE